MILTDQTDADLKKVCDILSQRMHEIDQRAHVDMTYWAEHRAAIDAGDEFETPRPIPATTEVLEDERLILSSFLRIIILGATDSISHTYILQQCELLLSGTTWEGTSGTFATA